ncbi:uncharacterized protein ACOB8E_009202 [Sarcophilus harrisii]
MALLRRGRPGATSAPALPPPRRLSPGRAPSREGRGARKEGQSRPRTALRRRSSPALPYRGGRGGRGRGVCQWERGACDRRREQPDREGDTGISADLPKNRQRRGPAGPSCPQVRPTAPARASPSRRPSYSPLSSRSTEGFSRVLPSSAPTYLAGTEAAPESLRCPGAETEWGEVGDQSELSYPIAQRHPVKLSSQKAPSSPHTRFTRCSLGSATSSAHDLGQVRSLVFPEKGVRRPL